MSSGICWWINKYEYKNESKYEASLKAMENMKLQPISKCVNFSEFAI